MRPMREEDIPPELRGSGIAREGNLYLAPQTFNHIWIGWYLNHSGTPNSEEREEECFYAARDIAAGEEITVDYNNFNESDAKRDAYHRRS
jgi:SET domain-containing protein